MSHFVRCVVVLGVLGIAACSQTPVHRLSSAKTDMPCEQRATQIIAANVTAIESHRYRDASLAAEQAARASLKCASSDTAASDRFSDDWRGTNALVVSAELAHQASDNARARRLLHEGFAIMHELRPPHHVSELTSALIAEKLDTARRDLQGEWAYW